MIEIRRSVISDYSQHIQLSNQESILFSLINIVGLREILSREAIPFAVSLIVAQLYFKWGSFALELIGFLALWLTLGAMLHFVQNTLKK